MSHFLQRLASSVTKPTGPAGQPALRPLLGSIYTPQSFDATGEQAMPVEATESVAPAAREFVARPERESRAAISIAHGDPAESESSSTQGESAESHLPAARTHDPLRPEIAPRREALFPLEGIRSSDVSDSIPASRRGIDHSSDDRTVTLLPQAHEGARAKIFAQDDRPLIPPAKPATSAGQTLARQLAGGSKVRAANREAARQSGQSGREPDEISIHIGRIEVTAAPQPVVRPAPAPARRSVNLDEYLRRGNGRAR
ncbi:MAG: hypothetical protein WBE38_05880 [Terracidiphilus sp.]|jgi:hypothetical protein